MALTECLTPAAIVRELDKYIIGQDRAKRSVAIALRNRYRRQRLQPGLREEVTPKNILMIGPTGVGKTEIARRLAKLANAPFIKVEATKFTEVGYVGRDVDSIIRDLLETAIRTVKAEKIEAVRSKAEAMVEDRLLDLLAPLPSRQPPPNPLAQLFGSVGAGFGRREDEGEFEGRREVAQRNREEVRHKLRLGLLEDQAVEVEMEDNMPPMVEVFSGSGMEEMGINVQDLFGGILPKRRKRRKATVSEARSLLAQEEAQRLLDMDEVTRLAVERTEQSGIVFIDEIDKIAGRERGVGPDVSREGVQRDILPIIEGSTVMTKHGPVRTDHILFIAAGAFHVSKPSDLIPELQGRLPIRVELDTLTRRDFVRILVEPENALVKQYTALLATDGVELVFAPDGIEAVAETADLVNQQAENIGARRLYTIMEKLLEDVSFSYPPAEGGAPPPGDSPAGPARVTVDGAYVRSKLADIVKDQDLSRYIL